MDASLKALVENRAYHLFLKRGGVHGYAIQDWAQAEKEIRAELEKKKNAVKNLLTPGTTPKMKMAKTA